MYFHIVRFLHVPISIFFGIVDLLLNPIYRLLGFQHDAFLDQWQATLGPKPPLRYPPKRLPGEPEYPFSVFDTTGHFRAAVVVDYIDRDVAQSMLPNYLELAPGRGVPAGKHPVVLIFGFEEKIRPVFAPWKGVSYAEFVIALPDTRLVGVKDGYAEPFFYMPQLRLIRLYPITLGLLVGYRKRLTRMPATENVFGMKTWLLGKPIASCSVRPEGKPQKMAGLNSPAIELWRERLNQPMVAKIGPTGILFTHYQWEWDSAVVQSAEAGFSVEQDLIPAYPPAPEPYSWPAFTEERGTGAMLVFLAFEWLTPFSRKVLDEHHRRRAEKAKAAAAR